ncbi:MAG: hypothetical protein ACOYN3_10340, partial [Acidimicrobiia bacterium]
MGEHSEPGLPAAVEVFQTLLSRATAHRIREVQPQLFAALGAIREESGVAEALRALQRIPRSYTVDARGRSIAQALFERWVPEVSDDDLLSVVPNDRPDLAIAELFHRGRNDAATVFAAIERNAAVRERDWHTLVRLDTMLIRQVRSTIP